MDTPRRRGLVLAYLRGLLLPELQFNYTSQIREHLVTQALLRETDAAALARLALMEGQIMASMTQSSKFSQLSQGVLSRLSVVSALYKHLPADEIGDVDEPGADHDLKKMGAAWRLLKRTDFFDRMRATLEADG